MKKTIPILAVLIVFALGATVYLYQNVTTLKADPNKAAADEATALVAKVGKLIMLPTGEVPTVATVTDPDKLKGQPFFAEAKAGDKVLVYASTKTVYLYSVSENKILSVAPLTIGQGTTVPTKPASTSTTTSKK